MQNRQTDCDIPRLAGSNIGERWRRRGGGRGRRRSEKGRRVRRESPDRDFHRVCTNRTGLIARWKKAETNRCLLEAGAVPPRVLPLNHVASLIAHQRFADGGNNTNLWVAPLSSFGGKVGGGGLTTWGNTMFEYVTPQHYVRIRYM